MADLQITQLPAIASGSVAATDPLALADVSASETKKVTVKDLVARGVAVIDAATIPATALSYPLTAGQIVTATLADSAVTTVKIANLSITAVKIANDTITATQIAENAIGSSELANDSVDTASIVDLNVTEGKLATGAVTNTKISDTTIAYAKLNLSDGDIPGVKLTSQSVTGTQIADNAISSSEIADGAVVTAKIGNAAVTSTQIASDTIVAGNIAANAIGASELADNAVDTGALASNAVTTVKITDANITTAKIANLAITSAKIANDTITATQIAANAVGASELADNAVDTAALAVLSVTTDKISSLAVTDAKIANATITAAKLATSTINRSLNVADGNLGINNAVTGGASSQSGITYNAEGLITATTSLVASDLPEATTSAIGAVSVPTAGGLSVTNLGAISITNAVSGGAATRSGITFNAQGLITSTVALIADDLPAATTSAIGAVSVPTASAPLAVDGNGVLSLADSGVTAGTYEKVVVNAQGIITDGEDLAAADIPDLDAAIVTSGQFTTARIADNAITMDQVGNNAISFIQEAQPDITDLPTGVYWLQESTGQLRIFNGNSWFSVGFGRLAEENLRFSGTFNATNGLIVTLTSFGTSAGFSVGTAIPAGTASITGCYFVCITPGNGTAVVPSTAFDAGDWALCMGPNDWDRIDTLSGPGSVSALDDLSDVTINSPTAGQFFEYAADGQWKNVSEIAGGTY